MKTPAELRALAAHLTERATEAARQRKVDVAALLLVEAADARDEAERLERAGANTKGPVDKTFANVHDTPMTSAQLAKRGRRIAAGHAGDNQLLLAISKSKWGSAAVYAKARFGIARSTFSQYMSGKVQVPEDVAKQVAKDFPGIDWTWPRQ